jgi:hypothetical protein
MHVHVKLVALEHMTSAASGGITNVPPFELNMPGVLDWVSRWWEYAVWGGGGRSVYPLTTCGLHKHSYNAASCAVSGCEGGWRAPSVVHVSTLPILPPVLHCTMTLQHKRLGYRLPHPITKGSAVTFDSSKLPTTRQLGFQLRTAA